MGEEKAKKKKGMHETVTMDELHRPLLMKEYARERVSPKNTHKVKANCKTMYHKRKKKKYLRAESIY